jgi:hypothetical protein
VRGGGTRWLNACITKPALLSLSAVGRDQKEQKWRRAHCPDTPTHYKCPEGKANNTTQWTGYMEEGPIVPTDPNTGCVAHGWGKLVVQGVF